MDALIFRESQFEFDHQDDTIMWAVKSIQRSFNLNRNVCTKSIGIIGVPFGKGAGKEGAEHGPKALRDSGLIDEIKSISPSIDVKDYGDVHYDAMNCNGRKINNLKNLEHVAAYNKA